MPDVVLSTVEGFQVPLMPLDETEGSDGILPPEQTVRAVPKLKVGVLFGLTVTVNVVVVAHWPVAGVKVYVPDALLSTVEGFHVPVMPFEDVDGKAGTEPPAQIDSDVPKLNAGTTLGDTVTVNVTGTAHCPAVVVKVYTPEVPLSITEGFQLPVIPLEDVVGNEGTVAPAQIVRLVPKLNVGVVFGFTVTAKVTGTAHCPDVGVNV